MKKEHLGERPRVIRVPRLWSSHEMKERGAVVSKSLVDSPNVPVPRQRSPVAGERDIQRILILQDQPIADTRGRRERTLTDILGAPADHVNQQHARVEVPRLRQSEAITVRMGVRAIAVVHSAYGVTLKRRGPQLSDISLSDQVAVDVDATKNGRGKILVKKEPGVRGVRDQLGACQLAEATDVDGLKADLNNVSRKLRR